MKLLNLCSDRIPGSNRIAAQLRPKESCVQGRQTGLGAQSEAREWIFSVCFSSTAALDHKLKHVEEPGREQSQPGKAIGQGEAWGGRGTFIQRQPIAVARSAVQH